MNGENKCEEEELRRGDEETLKEKRVEERRRDEMTQWKEEMRR